MAYQFDIFISYRRDPETLAWIQAHLVPLLQTHVGNSLGRQPSFYLDVAQEAPGAAWPAALGNAIGNSRIVLVLWTKRYLNSVWCTTELSQMVQRQIDAGLGTAAQPVSLVVPAFIHDGESFPPTLAHLQPMAIQPYFSSRMVPNGSLAQQLETEIKAKADHIADCIDAAPAWNPAWGRSAAAQLFQQLHQSQAQPQAELPRYTG
jgi:hypothetical protein